LRYNYIEQVRQLVNFRHSFCIRTAALALALSGGLAGCSGNQQRAMDLMAQADALLQAGKVPEARRAIQDAIRERDDIASVYIEAGRIEVAAQSLVAAYRAYSEALALDATNVEALQAVSQLGYIVGARDEADKAASRLLVVQPGDPNGLLIRGLVSLGQQRYDSAEEYANRILGTNPTDVRGLILKARILYGKGDAEKAAAILAPVAGAQSLPVTQTLLELHRAQGDAAGMLRDFAALAQIRPGNVRQRIDEANLRYKTADQAGARAVIRQVIARGDVTAEDMPRILSLFQQYDPDPFPMSTAAEAPRFGTDWARRGVVRHFLDAGNAAKALALLGSADSSDDRGLRARGLAMQGQTAQAGALVDAVLADDKTQCDALLARAWSNRLSGKARKAIIDAQQAVAECPGEPGGYFELARAFQAAGDKEGEFRTFDSALEALPQDAVLTKAYYDRAMGAGEVARAASVARRSTRLAPSMVLGWTLLGDACRRQADAVCLEQAAAGLKAATRAYGLDPLPGEPPSSELFGSLEKRP